MADLALSNRSLPLVVSRRQVLAMLGVVGLIVLASVEFYACVFRYDNDFLWHRHFGIAFLRDQVYDTFGAHYLPGRAMINAVTAWMPYRVDRAIWLLASWGVLAWSVRFWSRTAAPRAVSGPAAFAALGVTACYIHRDFVECGLQVLLLGMISAGLYGLLRGRPALCGWSLALATVYKVTPVLFLPYLLWKRQWRAAGWMALATVVLCLSPSLYLGWEQNLALHRQWLAFAARSASLDDPSENGVEVPVLHNQSLPLLLARLVQEYPQGHPLRTEGALKVQFASLSASDAKHFVQGGLLLMAMIIAWRMRKPAASIDAQSLAGEWAAVCIFVAILSPLCWLQHLVLALPAVLLFAQRAAQGGATRWQWSMAGFATALALLVHRDLLGMTLCEAISLVQPHTLAALFAVTLALCAKAQEQAAPVLLQFTQPMRAENYRIAA